MKTKSYLMIVSIILMLVFNSCSDMKDGVILQDDESIVLSPDEYVSVAYDTPKTISTQQAVDIVRNFSLQNSTKSSVYPTVINKKELSDTIRLQGKIKEVSIPIYELSLGNKGGYAVVSADERMPEIISYSTNSDLCTISRNTGAMKMKRMSERVVLSRIAHIELLKDSLREKTLEKLAKQLKVEKVNFNSIKNRVLVDSATLATRSGVKHPNVNKAWRYVLPMIKTTWDQGYPYNRLLDEAKGELHAGNNHLNAVGCAGVASTQIIAFYRAISSANGCILNWDRILSDPVVDSNSDEDILEQVSQLMKCVAYGVKTEWNNSSDNGNTNIKNVYDYFNTINLTFDIRSKGKGYAMNATRIITSLDQGFPVFVTGNDTETGSGHLWILDGYLMFKKDSNARMQIMTSDTYIHANFGWGGIYDGYYLVDSGTTDLTFQNQHDYSSGMMLYPNVRKKQ